MNENGIQCIVYMVLVGIDGEILGMMGWFVQCILKNVFCDYYEVVKFLKVSGFDWIVVWLMGLMSGLLIMYYCIGEVSISENGCNISCFDVVYFFF